MFQLFRNSFWIVILACGFYLLFVVLFSNISLGDKRLIMSAMPYLQKNGGHERILFEEWAKSNENYDAIVLGSSHAYRGYDPRIFRSHGISIFNLGTSSQHPVASELIYDEFARGRSKVVIYDLYDVVFEIEGIECSLRLIQNLPAREQASKLCKLDLRYMNAMAVREATLIQADEAPMREYIERGYCEKKGMLYQTEPLTDSVFNKNEEMFEAFERHIKKMQADGVKIILCSHPLPQNPGIHNYHNGFLQDLKPIIEKYQLPYLDFTYYSDGFGREQFADLAHLNQQGVEFYNNMLLNTPSFVHLLK
jgi:hypothetical protein